MITVMNLATGEKRNYSKHLGPEKALIAAYWQGGGNDNTWEYDTRPHPKMYEGQHCLSIEDWSVYKDGREF